ncbi:MAG TPA: FtsL-like putative cell division protein [Phnomibacter sp.]|nr:FtsL-like putative cell division protein [Phnomibacter sp.]
MNKTSNKKKKLQGIKSWMQAQWLVKYVPFALYLAVLAVLYIGNGHFADNVIRDIGKASVQLRQVQYEYKTLKAEVMYRSRESELAKAVEYLQLKRDERPPILIKKQTNP